MDNSDSRVSLETYLTLSPTLKDDMADLRSEFNFLCDALHSKYMSHGVCTSITYSGFTSRQPKLSYAYAAFHIMFSMQELLSLIVPICDYVAFNPKIRDHLSFLKAFYVVYTASFDLHENCSRFLKMPRRVSSRKRIRLSDDFSNTPNKLITSESCIDLSTPTKNDNLKIDLDSALTFFLREKDKYAKTILIESESRFDFQTGKDLNCFLQDCLCLIAVAIDQIVENVPIISVQSKDFFGTTKHEITCESCGPIESYTNKFCYVFNATISEECNSGKILSMVQSGTSLSDGRKCQKCENHDTLLQKAMFWNDSYPEYIILGTNKDENREKTEAKVHPDQTLVIGKKEVYYLYAIVSHTASMNGHAIYKVTCVRSLNIDSEFMTLDWEWVSMENDIITSCGCFSGGTRKATDYINACDTDVMNDNNLCLFLYSRRYPCGDSDRTFPYPFTSKKM